MLDWLKKLLPSPRPKLPNDWYWADFVLGPEPPRLPSSRINGLVNGGVAASELPPDLLPGFSAVGRFDPGYPWQTGFEKGKATLVNGDSSESRPLPEFPGFEVLCYPSTAAEEPPDELWGLIRERLPFLHSEALFARLSEPTGSDCACFAAVGHMFWLKGQPQRDKAQQAMLDFLESAPIFMPLGQPVEGPKRWTVAELLAAKAVFPVPEAKASQIDGRERLPHLAPFQEGNVYSALSEFYSLPRNFEAEQKALQALTTDLTSSYEQDRALDASFGQISRTSYGWKVPLYGHPDLELDMKARVVRGPVEGTQGPVEISLDQLKRVDLDRREVQGDTKTHEYFYLLISDGRKTLIYYERYKDYYEGGSVQADLDRYQFKAKACLHAFADALGCPNRRFACGDLLTKNLEQLL